MLPKCFTLRPIHASESQRARVGSTRDQHPIFSLAPPTASAMQEFLTTLATGSFLATFTEPCNVKGPLYILLPSPTGQTVQVTAHPKVPIVPGAVTVGPHEIVVDTISHPLLIQPRRWQHTTPGAPSPRHPPPRPSQPAGLTATPLEADA